MSNCNLIFLPSANGKIVLVICVKIVLSSQVEFSVDHTLTLLRTMKTKEKFACPSIFYVNYVL